MKSNLEKPSNLERKLNIEVPAEIVQSSYEKIYANIQKNAEIKGFRKGKAPLETIKSIYGDRVKQEVLEDLIQRHFYAAIKEHDLRIISEPNFEFDDLHHNKDFAFSAHFEIHPEVNLKKYEGLTFKKEKYEEDKEKFEKVLENIKMSKAENVPVIEDRPAQLNDVAVIDFEGFIGGQPLENGKGENHHLELGSNQFIPGFEEGVVGMTIDQTKTIKLKFPENYTKDLSGKEVEFKVSLKKLMKKSIPELTDDLLKNMGANQTVEELKAAVRKDLEASDLKRIDEELKNEVLKVLVHENPVEVPSTLLNAQTDALVNNFQNRMKERGMTEDDFKDYKEKWRKDFEKTATEMVQASFLVEAIAAKHSLHCNDEDFNIKIDEYCKQTGIEHQKVMDYYSEADRKNRLYYQITEDKVIKYLMDKASVIEVPKSQLKKDN